MTAPGVTRHDDVRLIGDSRRVIVKPFLPGDQIFPDGRSRLDIIATRILGLSEAEVAATLAAVIAGFADRHRDFVGVLEQHYRLVAERLELRGDLTAARMQLIGAYFTHEYSIEAAALGNPSMVLGPDQSGLRHGEARIVMSLRAVGEGHISSVEFRSGVVGADATVVLEAPSRFAVTGRRTTPMYDRGFFRTKLADLGAMNDVAAAVLDSLSDHFTMRELDTAVRDLGEQGLDWPTTDTVRTLHWLASSNYRVSFDPSTDLSERVIFPGGPTESRGMEDVRLVRFVQDDGDVVYYGTYTAFDGHTILPQLIETRDFISFRIATLSGESAQNKGIALFPRKLDGRFAALGRHDNVNNFLMLSDDVRVWREAAKIQEPERPWELIQLGNCGSPIETEAGWLVITHGVGAMRTYTLGAVLLDIDDPHRVIGSLDEPLLTPGVGERDGYVPNVVYSCGGLIHDDRLLLPYGFADVGASIVTIDLGELLTRLLE